jgi:hypothetical protein
MSLSQFSAKDFRSITQYVGTKTLTQVRTHAQKYFQKHSSAAALKGGAGAAAMKGGASSAPVVGPMKVALTVAPAATAVRGGYRPAAACNSSASPGRVADCSGAISASAPLQDEDYSIWEPATDRSAYLSDAE